MTGNHALAHTQSGCVAIVSSAEKNIYSSERGREGGREGGGGGVGGSFSHILEVQKALKSFDKHEFITLQLQQKCSRNERPYMLRPNQTEEVSFDKDGCCKFAKK